MLPARMRSSAGWSDACILNLSSSGLLVYALGGAEPGTFVEIRRGNQLVIARVVWRQNQRVGLQSTSPVPIGAIISCGGDSAAAAAIPTAAPLTIERRRIARDSDRSRMRGRAFEFASIVFAAAVLGGSVAAYVTATLSKPMARLSSTLAGT